MEENINHRIFELLIIRKHEYEERIKYRKYSFIGYLALSVLFVLGAALFFLII